jgi:hypothetical protein
VQVKIECLRFGEDGVDLLLKGGIFGSALSDGGERQSTEKSSNADPKQARETLGGFHAGHNK